VALTLVDKEAFVDSPLYEDKVTPEKTSL